MGLTIDRERAYQRKLDNLGKRYDALKEELAKFKLCEVPPVKIRDMIAGMECHMVAAIKHYRRVLEDASFDLHKRKCTEGMLRSAIEAKECLAWLNEMRGADVA